MMENFPCLPVPEGGINYRSPWPNLCGKYIDSASIVCKGALFLLDSYKHCILVAYIGTV